MFKSGPGGLQIFEELLAIINDSAPGVPLDLLGVPVTSPGGIFGPRRDYSEAFWHTFRVPKKMLSIKIQYECPSPCPPHGSSVNRGAHSSSGNGTSPPLPRASNRRFAFNLLVVVNPEAARRNGVCTEAILHRSWQEQSGPPTPLPKLPHSFIACPPSHPAA